MRWVLPIVLALFLGILFLIPLGQAPVSAQPLNSTVYVTITAIGWVEGLPPGSASGLTISYINDNEVGLTWEKGIGCNKTMIRRGYETAPQTREEGFLVYYGTGTNTSDYMPIGMSLPPYYSVWCQSASGNWSSSTEGEGNFVSASWFFFGLIGLAGMLTFFSYKRRHILIGLSAALVWLAMGFWVLLSGVANLALTDVWTQILAWVFIIMAFASLLVQMDIEIRHEEHGKSWTEYGKNPKRREPSTYESYRSELRRRLGK